MTLRVHIKKDLYPIKDEELSLKKKESWRAQDSESLSFLNKWNSVMYGRDKQEGIKALLHILSLSFKTERENILILK